MDAGPVAILVALVVVALLMARFLSRNSRKNSVIERYKNMGHKFDYVVWGAVGGAGTLHLDVNNKKILAIGKNGVEKGFYDFDDVVGLRLSKNIVNERIVHSVIIEMRDIQNPVYRFDGGIKDGDKLYASLKLVFGMENVAI